MKTLLSLIACLALGFGAGWLARSPQGYENPQGSEKPGSKTASDATQVPPSSPPIDPKIANIEEQHKGRIEAAEKELQEKQKGFDEALASGQTQNELMPIFQDLVEAKRNLEWAQFSKTMELRNLQQP